MTMRGALLMTCVAWAAVGAAACATAPARSGAGGGQALYRTRCSSCHRPYDPAERTGADWTVQLDRMAARAHLSPEDREAILGFLQANAKGATGAR